MKQYSFLMEFNPAAAKQAGSGVMNWIKANPAKAGAIGGAVAGGAINKAKGNSFTGGALKGAAVGAGVGFGAGKIAGTKFGKNVADTTKKIMGPAPKAPAAAKQTATATAQAVKKTATTKAPVATKQVAKTATKGYQKNPIQSPSVMGKFMGSANR